MRRDTLTWDGLSVYQAVPAVASFQPDPPDPPDSQIAHTRIAEAKQIKPICKFVSTIYNGDGYWWSSSPRRCVGPIALVQRTLLRPQLCDQHLLVIGDSEGRWPSSHRGSSSAPNTVTVARGGRVRRSVGIGNARHGLGVLCPRPSPQPRPTERWSDPFQRRPKSHVMRCLWRRWAGVLGRRQWWRQWRRPTCR